MGSCKGQRKPGEVEVTRITNLLGTKLLEVMLADHENVVISPLGVATNLAMVMEGLDPRPTLEIAQVLGIDTDSESRQRLRSGFRSILIEFEQRQNDSEVAGTFINAGIFSSLPLVPAYKNLLVNYYRANITHHKLPENTTEHRLQLTSDSGVLSHWKDYDKQVEYTYLKHQDTAPFTNQVGDIVSAPMIPFVGVFRAGYIPKLDSLAVQLPLQAETFTLFLVVPDARDAIGEVISRMTKESVPLLAAGLPRTHAEVSLPQASLASLGLDLVPYLTQIGISAPFKASVKGGSRVSVTSFKHNSYFGLSFVGIKSVSSEEIALSKQVGKRGRRDVSTRIVVNKPFIFFVLHRRTGLVLLSGILTNPTQLP